MQIGIAGLGRMGAAIAARLTEVGHTLTVWNRSPQKLKQDVEVLHDYDLAYYSLDYPTEAYYHGIFLFAMLMVVRRRIGWALGSSALLSMSHPYTGLSLALTRPAQKPVRS